MLRLNLATSSSPAYVEEAYPNRYDYEVTPTSSEDSDSSFDGYERHHVDEETGARAEGLFTKRAKIAPTGGGPKPARRGAIAPNSKADAALTKAGKSASKGEVRAAKREAKRASKEASSKSKEASSKSKEPPPLQRQSRTDELVEGENQLREDLLQERSRRKEKMQKRIDAGVDRAAKVAALKASGGAACLRHCGTSCGSVLFQSVCACIAIACAFWVGFIVLGFFEVIGISSLPPGIKYGHKVGDIY
jgi:hypothetical protein